MNKSIKLSLTLLGFGVLMSSTSMASDSFTGEGVGKKSTSLNQTFDRYHVFLLKRGLGDNGCKVDAQSQPSVKETKKDHSHSEPKEETKDFPIPQNIFTQDFPAPKKAAPAEEFVAPETVEGFAEQFEEEKDLPIPQNIFTQDFPAPKKAAPAEEFVAPETVEGFAEQFVDELEELKAKMAEVDAERDARRAARKAAAARRAAEEDERAAQAAERKKAAKAEVKVQKAEKTETQEFASFMNRLERLKTKAK